MYIDMYCLIIYIVPRVYLFLNHTMSNCQMALGKDCIRILTNKNNNDNLSCLMKNYCFLNYYSCNMLCRKYY